MNTKNLKHEVLDNLKKGKSKTEIYYELRSVCDDEELRKTLASRPSHNISKSQRLIHKVICGFWTLIFMLELIGLYDLFFEFEIKDLITFGVTAYLFVQLWRFNGNVFLSSILWLIYGIFTTLKELYKLPTHSIDYHETVIISWVFVIILIIVIALTDIVRKNVFSYYHWFRPVTDDYGRIMFEEE